SLPQNFNAELLGELNGDGVSVAAGNGGNPAGGMVDMRGWGANETVFLLNGVRMPKAYTGVMLDNDRATPDLRSIPLASIERIEILSSAGSAIYGAGATGGVINIITRRDYRGGQVALNYDATGDGQSPTHGLTVNFGLPLKWGFAARMSAGYSDSEPLRAGDRADVTIHRWRRLALERDPARLFTTVAG